jgi:putative flippase GtrA
MKGISALMVIGLADALIHWQVFFVLCSAGGLSQAASNFTAFCVAAAFTLYVNLLYTFESGTSLRSYLLFIGVMAGVSVGVGSIGDAHALHGLVTVASFTVLNLLLGYGFFRFVLFRRFEI